MDLIERVFELRKSGQAAVVSEAGRTDLQARMHVTDALETWLLSEVVAWKETRDPCLLVLSGNAGDGKSGLLARLEPHIKDEPDIVWIADATQAEEPTDNQFSRLADFLAPFSDDGTPQPKLHVVA